MDGAFNGRNILLMGGNKSLVIDTQNLLESNLGYEYMKERFDEEDEESLDF